MSGSTGGRITRESVGARAEEVGYVLERLPQAIREDTRGGSLAVRVSAFPGVVYGDQRPGAFNPRLGDDYLASLPGKLAQAVQARDIFHALSVSALIAP